MPPPGDQTDPPTVPAPDPEPMDSAPTSADLGEGWRPPSAPRFAQGALLAGRFRIVRFIARGGMGEVFEAEDLELRERVALKMVRSPLADDSEMVERFRLEVQLARRVTHPNVCRIFDVFRHQPAAESKDRASVAFLTMELLEGESLADRLAREGPLSTQEAWPIVEQIGAGLAAAHHAGIMHRDLKSSNVTLVGSGPVPRVVITDFGLAAWRRPDVKSHEDGPKLGTPTYMAPEQVAGEAVTAAADVYSLGIVIYEMLTGKLPFTADTPHQAALKRLREPPTPPREHIPGIDPRWEAVVLRCLERDPKRRFASAEDVLAALRGRTAPSVHRPVTWLALAVVAVLLALSIGKWPFRSRGSLTARTVQLTTSRGLDLFPAFAPDGRSLAFASNRNGHFQLYVRGVEPAAAERELTNDDGENLQPAWSPDGTRLAYHSKRRGGIWTLPAEGGKPARLTRFGSHPTWSPDGRQVAFQSDAVEVLAANASPASSPSSLWIVASSGGEPRPLTHPGEPPGGHGTPTWSPDGGHIVFGTFGRQTASLWSVRPDGSGLERLVDGQQLFDPVFDQDGRAIFYSAILPSGDHGVFRVGFSPRTGRTEGEPRRVSTVTAGAIRHLARSADGRMAYCALTMASNLFRLELDDAGLPVGQPVPLTAETGRNSRPAFSPDGQRIVFERWRSGMNPDIWLMDRDGGHPQPVATDPTTDSLPSFVAGGTSVAFFSFGDGRRGLYTVDLSTRTPVLLRSIDQRLEFPRLSAQGDRFAFGSREGGETINLWIQDVVGGPARQLTFDEESVAYPVWSPDGRSIAAQERRGRDSQVVLVDVETGALTPLTRASGQSWAYSFSPDGDRIAFGGLRDGFWNVYWVSTRGGAEHQLTHYARPDVYVRYPAWSPNGREVVYELAETSGNVWLLEIDD
jgi:Tol biopolymer transport system component/serine/threonine protein kinase